MISQELLSEVLGWKDIHIVHTKLDMVVADTEENFSDPDWDEDWEYGVNIYELAHKCKEWANKNGYYISSWVTSDNDGFAESNEYGYTAKEMFNADTEPEAIFKACEWILVSTDTKSHIRDAD